MKEIKLKFKKNKYSSARGGSSQFLNIYCGKCNEFLLTYQKDGPGVLLRLYVDRIEASPYKEQFTEGFEDTKEMTQLVCQNPECGEQIGSPMLYTKDGENRLAYRLIGPIRKEKNKKGIYPSASSN